MISSVLWRTGRLARLAVVAAACAALAVHCAGAAGPRPVRCGYPNDGSTAWTDVDVGQRKHGCAKGRTRCRCITASSRWTRLHCRPSWRRRRQPLGHQYAAAVPVELALPMPQGGFQRFAVETSPVMAPVLAAQFPDIQTYRGRGIDDPTATVRLGLRPRAFTLLSCLQRTPSTSRSRALRRQFTLS